MKFSDSELQALCKQAIHAAQSAGAWIMTQSREHLAVENKSEYASKAAQVVTQVDRGAQDLILQALPQEERIGILAEESKDNQSRFTHDYFWCIDPLDGTLAFLEGNYGYSVSIALVRRDGVPVIGIIYDPVANTLYHAVYGCGAFINGNAFHISACTSQQFLLMPLDQSLMQRPEFPRIMETIEGLAKEFGYTGVTTRNHGGAVLNACWVLENAPALYFKLPRLQPGGGGIWDYAATACLFAESGAIASDIYGEPLELNRKEGTWMSHKGVLYATDRDIHQRMIHCLASFAKLQ